MTAAAGQSVLSTPQSADKFRAVPYSGFRWLCIAAAVVLGAVQAYFSRYMIGVDGVSYLDIGSAYWRHDWHAAVNGYWSPLYSWILSVVMEVVSPSIHAEYPWLHVVNFACYCVSLFAFSRFWDAVKVTIGTRDEGNVAVTELFPKTCDFTVYLLFYCLFSAVIRPGTPDMLASIFIFDLARQSLKTDKTVKQAVLFGILVALAYFAKTILIYFGLGILVLDLFRDRKFKPFVISIVTFAVLVSPWFFALHSKYGEWTAGSSGKMNYIWFVNGCPTGPLLEENAPNSAETQFFPGERVFESPAIFRAEVLPHITFTPYNDPAVFDGARKPEFHIRQQLRALGLNLQWLREWVLIGHASITILALALLLGTGRPALWKLWRLAPLIVPIVGVIELYTLVFIRSERYIVAFAAILLAIALAGAEIPRKNSRTMTLALMATCLAVFIATHLASTLGSAVRSDTGAKLPNVAEAVRAKGYGDGTRVGSLGWKDGMYWSHLARMRVETVTWDDDRPKFWTLSAEVRDKAVCAMFKAGDEIVVGEAGKQAPPGWTPLGTTGFYLLSSNQMPSCR